MYISGVYQANSVMLLKRLKTQKYVSFQSISKVSSLCRRYNFLPFVRKFLYKFIYGTNKAKNKSPPLFIDVPVPASNLSLNIYKYIYVSGIEFVSCYCNYILELFRKHGIITVSFYSY